MFVPHCILFISIAASANLFNVRAAGLEPPGQFLQLTQRTQPLLNSYLRAKARTPSPRIFFLFLTMDGVHRGDLWDAFFQGVDREQYHSFIHCRSPSRCDTGPLEAVQVTPVASEYCTDLVSPMVQLLKVASAESRSPLDKFAFISESTLPVKPFAFIYKTLTSNQNSDFCVSPERQWLELSSKDTRAWLIQHSQWVVLSRDHAQTMIRDWPRVKRGISETDFAIRTWIEDKKASGQHKVTDFFALPRDVPRCADEWAFVGTIYGLIQDTGLGKVPLPGFSDQPLFVNGPKATDAFQSSCRTFAAWGYNKFNSPKMDVMKKIFADRPKSRLVCVGLAFVNGHLTTESDQLPCNDTHPAQIDALSDQGAAALRASSFLFARKFSPEIVTLDQFRRVFLKP